jgi:hypothetical protein
VPADFARSAPAFFVGSLLKPQAALHKARAFHFDVAMSDKGQKRTFDDV